MLYVTCHHMPHATCYMLCATLFCITDHIGFRSSRHATECCSTLMARRSGRPALQPSTARPDLAASLLRSHRTAPSPMSPPALSMLAAKQLLMAAAP